MRQLGLALSLFVFWIPPAIPWEALRPDRVWFTPGPGTLDMLRLFEAPEEWPRARGTIDVFKFYQQHTAKQPPAIVGPNSYDALVRSDAFRIVNEEWGKRIALEAGSVKDFYCTPDDSGMQASIRDTIASLDAVRAAGGFVSYIAMDEPFLAGQAVRCGGPALEPTADRLRAYITAVRRASPLTRVGLIEPYPFFGPEAFETMLRLMRDRGTPAAFLHVDVYLPALRPGQDAFGRDMIRLADLAGEYRIPFGIIIWGENGDADALYAADARRLADAVSRTFRSWAVMPDHLLFQSWAESSTGLRVTPRNLPETLPNTHTRLLNEMYAAFRDGFRGSRF